MKTNKHIFMKAALGIVAASTLAVASSPARATVLEAKWQAGQQLSYDLKLNGTMHLTAPEGTPMIAGLPLEIAMKGDGQSTLLTSDVDEFGTAIVAPRLDRLQLKLNETTFGQNGVLGVRDGKASFSLNGQSVMPTTDISQYLNPKDGLRITKTMHVVGTAPLAKTDANASVEVPTDAPKNGKKSPLAIPLNVALMVQALMARALPAVLPTKDVNAGDTWNANVQWPLPPNMNQPEIQNAFQNPAGNFALKAIGEEDVNGRKAWRINVDGTLQINEAQAKIISDEIAKQRAASTPNGAKPALPGGMAMPQLFALKQKIKGDFWFDAVAGQVVRADLNLDSSAQTRKNEKAKADGNTDFSGNFQMDLRKVSYEKS